MNVDIEARQLILIFKKNISNYIECKFDTLHVYLIKKTNQ